tara:strand:+ start:565 stop:765 length:201 start_codon:yes stop_codon:yes gene_type:complete
MPKTKQISKDWWNYPDTKKYRFSMDNVKIPKHHILKRIYVEEFTDNVSEAYKLLKEMFQYNLNEEV